MKYFFAIVGAVVILFLILLPVRPLSAPTVPVEKGEVKEATVMFGGDAMFDRTMRTVFENVGGDYLFSCIADVLAEPDAVVLNLEGPVTTYDSVSLGTRVGDQHNTHFTFPPQTAALLKRHNVSIVNLGNNHIADFGRDGVAQTKQFLTEAGVAYFGTSDTRVLRKDINGVPLSFVGYNEFEIPSVEKRIIYDIVRAESDAGRIVVVYTHWGDEYVGVPERVRVLAHELVDAGADLVVGSHPHIVQDYEAYGGGYIYYSLGNFVFDQYFSDEVRNGLLLEVKFTETGVQSMKEIPIVLNPDARTCLTTPTR